MKKFYSIHLHDDFTNILKIEKKRDILHVSEDLSMDTKEVTKFFSNKKNFYIIVDIEEALDEIATIPALIKKEAVLKSYLINTFKETLSTKNLLLNYFPISKNLKEETITYKVDAVSYKEYAQKLSLIENWLEIKSATIDKFALLNLTRKCFKPQEDFGYLSVHSQKNIVTILAIDEEEKLLFERTSVISVNPDDYLNNNATDEINQTIAYVKQQFRHIKFSTLLLSGSLTLDDIICEQLMLSIDMPIAVLYPNTFIKGLENEEPQHYIQAIGGCYVKKEEQFLPDKIFSLRAYHYTIIALSLFTALLFFLTSYMTLLKHDQYSDALDEYEVIKEKLLHTVKTTDTYSLYELKKSWEYLQNAEMFLTHRPSDSLLRLKPLIEMSQVDSYFFKNENAKIVHFNITLTKSFKSLTHLHDFKKMFFEKFQAINHDNTLKYIDKTDYADMNFFIVISQAEATKTISTQRRRRR